MTGERERERERGEIARMMCISCISTKACGTFLQTSKVFWRAAGTCYLKIHTKYIDSEKLVEFVFVGKEGSSDILFHHPFTRHTYLSPFSRAIFPKTRWWAARRDTTQLHWCHAVLLGGQCCRTWLSCSAYWAERNPSGRFGQTPGLHFLVQTTPLVHYLRAILEKMRFRKDGTWWEKVISSEVFNQVFTYLKFLNFRRKIFLVLPQGS